MEKIFEMPFMIKLQEFGQNLGNNKFYGQRYDAREKENQ